MEKMEVDDVVDLSLGSGRETISINPATARDLRALTQNSGLTITPAPPPSINSHQQQQQQHHHHHHHNHQQLHHHHMQPASSHMEDGGGGGGGGGGGRNRRVLRPRTEPKSYVECPDIVLLPAKINGRQQHNGNIDSDTDDDEMPQIIPIKELTAAEIWERERALRKLREELRNEETKLVLLKKLKQSQHVMKENIVVTPTNMTNNPLAAISNVVKGGSLSVTPTTALPIPAHSKNKSNTNVLRGQPTPGRSNTILPPPRSSLPGGATLTAGPLHRGSMINLPRTGSNLTITPSVTITPTSAPPAGIKPRNVPNNISSSVSITPALPLSNSSNHDQVLSKNDRSTPRDDGQTPAQRQAAAKLALRKQLEKTLLQIPPPKPPPPEMHFIPNPSNTEFVYLLGLEHVVDYITKDKKLLQAPQLPFRCAQCKIDFTPVWKWEKQGKGGNPTFQNTPAGKDPKVICEQCVTTNVKKALKQEHTNRLKTAFVKALQQEQEIEQRLATQNSPSPVESHHRTSTPTPARQEPITVAPPPPPAPVKTPTPRPTPPPPSQPTPPPPSQQSSSSRSRHSNVDQNAVAAAAAAQFGALGNLANNPSAAAAMQALQQQLFRGLQQGLAGNLAGNQAHMMQFTPLIYSYQLAMAQAAQAVAGKGASLQDLQRAAELQRQYLLDVLPNQAPGPSNNRQNNWKT